MPYKLYRIPRLKNTGGGYFETLPGTPFEVKRVYYIHSADAGAHRGGHAHKKLRQVMFCPYGSVTVTLDDGSKKDSVLLDDPSKALQIDPCLWREMDWNETGSVLCVLASDYYSEGDYIRDHAEFLRYIQTMSDEEENRHGVQTNQNQDKPV